MMKPLTDKVALVTGASRGIGAAIARRLAQDGAHVPFTYNQSANRAKTLAEELVGYGVKSKEYQVDAARLESLPTLVDQVAHDFGSIDILVNNAGIFIMGAIGEILAEDYERQMRVNVDAVFTLTNAAVKVMKPGSRIINIGSVLGERAAISAASVYNASKFAVSGFSRSWARDLGEKGILVNAIQPGAINTDMNPDTGEFADFMKSLTPLGRYGTPEEIAGVVSFLAGPDATFITGATINVDGGWNA